MSTTNDTSMVIGPVRLGYVRVWEPAAVEEGGEKKYSVSIIIPKSKKAMIKEINEKIDAAKELGKKKWGGKVPAKLKTPLRDGDEDKADKEEYANSLFIGATSTKPPGVVNNKREKVLDRDEVYSGMYGYVHVNFYPFDKGVNKGIACSLNHVMKHKDGEKLAGGVSLEQAFDKVEIDEDDDLLG